jgi:hypothetical protein
VWQAGVLYLTSNDACVANAVVYSCAAVAAVSTPTAAVLWRTHFGSQGADSYYPAARPDPGGDLSVASGISSPTMYLSGAIAAFVAGGQLVPTFGTIEVGSYPVLGSRYGDYFGAAIDPTHPHTIWAAAEVGNQPNGEWGTEIRTTAIDPELPTVGAAATLANPSQSQAAVSAVIDPAGTDTAYAFQYGTTTAYGSQTSAATIAGGTAP